MKKVYAVFGLAFLIIAACMVYLVREGVSLRTEPLIKPSPIDLEYKNITYGVVHRLFPNFQTADYVVWGVSLLSSEETKILTLVQDEYEKQFQKRPNLIQFTDKTTPEQLASCHKPCWVLLEKEKANEMSAVANLDLDKVKTVLGSNFFSITFLEFNLSSEEVPAVCENEKRLDLACVLPVSVREVRRRMKDSGTRYFFMRRYNDKDHFLFLQKAS